MGLCSWLKGILTKPDGGTPSNPLRDPIREPGGPSRPDDPPRGGTGPSRP
jgi:hypothetical protein